MSVQQHQVCDALAPTVTTVKGHPSLIRFIEGWVEFAGYKLTMTQERAPQRLLKNAVYDMIMDNLCNVQKVYCSVPYVYQQQSKGIL